MFAVKHPIMTHLDLKCILGHFEKVYFYILNLIDLVILDVLFELYLALLFVVQYKGNLVLSD